MRQSETPNPLLPGQLEKAARLLTDAFMPDPLYRWVQPDSKRRHRMLMWMHTCVLSYTMSYGNVITVEDVDGVACWLPPGAMELSTVGILRSGLFMLPFRIGVNASLRFNAYMGFSGRLRKQYAPQRYWYLWVIGVAPSRQRQGIGGQLVQPILEQADRQRMPAFLETENETNLSFYERCGFVTTAAGFVPEATVQVWSMLRHS